MKWLRSRSGPVLETSPFGTKKETLGLHSSNSEKFTVWYSNVDTLANKLPELRTLISNASSKPKLIALTEIKHKNKWDINLNELVIPGYNIFSNDLNTVTRCPEPGIVISLLTTPPVPWYTACACDLQQVAFASPSSSSDEGSISLSISTLNVA